MNLNFQTDKCLAQFNRNFHVTPSCWIWTGPNQGKLGYGRIYKGKFYTYAHRFSYELYKGPVPEGLVVRHKCDNPRCVNPEHLETGTQYQNTQDTKLRGRVRKGEFSGTASLSDKEAREIYDLARCGLFVQREIAGWYGVVQATISHIKTGHSRDVK